MQISITVLLMGLAVCAMISSRARWSGRRLRRQHSGSTYDLAPSRRLPNRPENARTERHERDYSLHPLNRAQYDRYTTRWRSIQARFADDPISATVVADHLIQEVLATRGYPMRQLEQNPAELTVDPPALLMQYRDARRVAKVYRDQSASRQELRRAFVKYRALFEDLVTPSRNSVPPRSHA